MASDPSCSTAGAGDQSAARKDAVAALVFNLAHSAHQLLECHRPFRSETTVSPEDPAIAAVTHAAVHDHVAAIGAVRPHLPAARAVLGNDQHATAADGAPHGTA